MHIHGVQDPIIAYGNTWDWKAWDSVGTMHDIPGLIRFWSDKFNCRAETVTEGEGSSHTVHDECDQGARVEHIRLDPGDHEWPQAINGEPTPQVIWSFLNDWNIG